LTDPSRRYTARWVLPVTDTPIRDGAVLVDAEGRITAIGPASDVPAPGHAEPFDLGESVLMPGLINVHAHLDLAHLRGSIEDTSFPDWIATLLAIKRRVTLTPAETVAVAHWSCIEAVAAGITTVATTEDSDAGFQALRESGLRGIAYREVFGPDPAQAPEAIAGARTAIARMREMESDLVRVGVSPHRARVDGLQRCGRRGTIRRKRASELQCGSHRSGPNLEELVEVGARDAEISQPLEQGQAHVVGRASRPDLVRTTHSRYAGDDLVHLRGFQLRLIG
jgi:cytosine/adenosine deaminase-related metal-dependent hydrolase